jgi:DNA-binding IclR family transcriptional regulator
MHPKDNGKAPPVRSDARGIQSVEAGYRLLELIAASAGPMSLTALAAGAGMATSRAHLYLTSFLRLGLVARATPGGLYDLGPAALQLGLAAISHLDAFRVAREAMYGLRDRTGGPVFLSVWGNRGPTTIHRIEGELWLPAEMRVGTVLPVLSATGRVMLAWFPERRARAIIERALQELPPRDPWEGTSVDESIALLAEVRKAGYARGRGYLAAGTGFVGLAAPIFDHEGEVVGAFTINANADNPDRAAEEALAASLLEVADRVSHEIGDRRHARSEPRPQR